MRQISKTLIAAVTVLALGLPAGGIAAPALAAKQPSFCDTIAAAGLSVDAAQAAQVSGGQLASNAAAHTAAFDEAGLTFTPKSADKSLASSGAVGFSLSGLRRGGKTIDIKTRPAGASNSVRSWSSCSNVAYRERGGGVVEAVGLYGTHVDLTYVLQRPVLADENNQDLSLVVALNTGMRAEQVAGGIRLTDEYLNGVVIGAPTAIDAAGRKTALQMTGDESALTITLPAGWLKNAKYPVTIDPTVITWTHGADAQYQPFIANDAGNGRALVTYVQISGSNYDVRYRLFRTTDGGTIADGSVTDTGSEVSPVATFNKNGPTGPEYMIAYARSSRLYAQRIDGDTGAAIGPEIANLSVPLKGGMPADAAIDPASGRTLVVWVTAPQPGDLRGVQINEGGTFRTTGFDIAATTNDERQPHVTYDPSMGRFVASWKQTVKNSYSILARSIGLDMSLSSTLSVKDSSSVNVTNRKIVYSADADTESGNPGKFLAVWNRVDTNDLVALRINNRVGNQLDTLGVTGGSFVIKAGKRSGWKFNDKTDAFPDLASSRKGWVVVWREQNNTVDPAYQVIHWVTVKDTGAVGTINDVTDQFDPSDTGVDNPVVVVLSNGKVITVHEEIPTATGQNTLILTIN